MVAQRGREEGEHSKKREITSPEELSSFYSVKTLHIPTITGAGDMWLFQNNVDKGQLHSSK